MTRLTATLPLPTRPASVALSELAIAAGAAGHSVTLCYEGFPAPVLCSLYRYCIRFAGPTEVQHVRTPKDLRDLAEAVGTVRLAILHNARLLTSAAWSIQMTPEITGDGIARPALFCGGDGLDLADDPGATVALRGDEAEVAAVTRWLALMQPEAPVWPMASPALTIQPEQALSPVLSPGVPRRAVLPRLRDQQVLRSLIVGAAVLRVVGQDPQELTEPTLTLVDYEQVRRLLQTRLVGAADDTCDPLAADMVGRANVYLSVKLDDCGVTGNPFHDSGGESATGVRPGHELITRREIADLGNVRSRIVRQLIGFLQRRPDGYERVQAMGLIRRSPSRNAYGAMTVDELTAYLRPWSAKQVRTHFDRMRRDGMISAEREHDNGPWRYALPEELNRGHSAFRRLPTAQALLERGQAG